jgi:TolB-like protein
VGAAAGTPYAMAPEQVRGDPADARTDIWALGVLLYEMVTGAPPFRAATVPELFSSILRDPPASWPAGVPVNIKSVIDRCLEKDPARRYQHAREVRAALDAVQSGLVPPWIAWRYYLARRRWPAAAAALLGVAAVVVAVNMGGVRERFGGNPPMPIKLAVLPFENLTGDPDQEYLSAGLTDEMITQLGRLHPQRLSVIARTSSMRYKSRDTPIDQIGRELGVGYLLEGSARREGTRVSISARLIRVRDQTQQWADSYTRELGGILTLQNDVAVGVARALALTLLPAEQARLTRAAQVNPEAYEARLRAVSYMHRGSREDLERALDWLDVALRKDPNYALAHLGVRSVWGYKMGARYVSSAMARPIMQAALQRALALDSSLPEAHGALATTYAWEQWNWEAAEREFVRALELDPTNAGIRSFYGRYLQITQRHAEGLAQMARAVEHDPLSELIRRQYANALIGARRYQEALEHMRSMPAGERNLPGHWNQLSRIFHLMGRYDEALDAEKRKWALFGDREMEEALAQGAAAGGYRMAMRRVADTLAARARKTGEACCWEMYVRAGAQEEALHWIERGVELRHPDIVHAGAPPFDSLRGHPRYQAVLQRLNLANRP